MMPSLKIYNVTWRLVLDLTVCITDAAYLRQERL